MHTEHLIIPGAADLHLLLSEFVEEIRNDDTILEGETSEQFENYKKRILEIFSKYDWKYLMSYINPEDKVWRSISFFYSDIVKFLIDKCKDKISINILLHEAVTLQTNLVGKIKNSKDFYAEDFCWNFSVSFVSRFAGA